MVQRTISAIDTVIIHCSATPNGRFHTVKDVDQWHGPGRVQASKKPFLRRPHLLTKHQPHLKHIGYHFVIRMDGVLETGRALEEVGAHAYKHNTHSVGICLVGKDKFTLSQWKTLESLVLTLKTALPNVQQVIGHNDLTNFKTCPGFKVHRWLQNELKPLPEHILNLFNND